MEASQNKTYVWSGIGRITHWLMAISFFACYITSFYENQLTLHISIGIVLFGMFLLKIVWGLIGPKYARWNDYNFSLNSLKNYFEIKIKDRYRKIEPGHNPASSWFAFLVTWLGIFCCISGVLLFGVQEASGIFSFLNKEYFSYSDILSNIHITLTYILIVMIIAHISGVIIEQFYHKTNVAMSMITGFKNAYGDSIEISKSKNLIGIIYISIFIVIATYTYYKNENIFKKSEFKKIDYKSMNPEFYYECSDCHNLYPPFLLPSHSWKILLKEQHNHFDEDLELDEETIKNIERFLIEYSSEHSTQESAYNIEKDLNKSNSYTITKTNYWMNTHSKINEKTFKSEKIESKSNCIACHRGFEQGLIKDCDIKITTN